MNAAKLASDPLWQCLCPSWAAKSATRSIQRASRARSQVEIYTKRSFSLTNGRSVYRPKDYNLVLNPLRTLPPEVASEKPKAPAYRALRPWAPSEDPILDTIDYTSETTTRLYTHLLSRATLGRVQATRELAEYLVRERRERPNLQLYHALILSNIDHTDGAAWRVNELLDEAHKAGVTLDNGICHAVLKVLAVHPDHLLRADILAHMRERWFAVSAEGAHDIAAGLFREGQLEQGLQQLESMRCDGVRIDGWLLDMVVYALCEVGEMAEAHRIMLMRVEDGELNLSRSVWWVFLEKAGEYRHLAAARLAWNLNVTPAHLNPPTGTLLNLLATAANDGDEAFATDIFKTLRKREIRPSPIHYELLITSYVVGEAPDLRGALNALSDMANDRVEPQASETRALYTYLRDRPACLEEAMRILRDLHSQGKRVPLAALNLLIECYIQKEDLASAIRVYKQIHTFVPLAEGIKKSFADASTFNFLLKGCRVQTPPDTSTASFLFEEMHALGVAPTVLTYDRLILVFLRGAGTAMAPPELSGTTTAAAPANEPPPNDQQQRPPGYAADMVNRAFALFVEMQTHGWLPRARTLRHLAIRLAMLSDQRCWEVLQVAEDSADRIIGWTTWAVDTRRSVSKRWIEATAARQDDGDGSQYSPFRVGLAEEKHWG